MTPLRNGARSDADATVVCSYGGADRLDEHNTLTAIAGCVSTVWTLSRGISDTDTRQLAELGHDPIAGMQSYLWAYVYAWRSTSVHLATDNDLNVAPHGA